MPDRSMLEAYGHVLTSKEREVFDLYARGLSQRSMALALGLSRSAVQSRLENATRKIARAKGAAA